MGTPDFSVPTLTSLINAGYNVVAAYTQPPRPAGRGQKEQESPVHKAALSYNIPIYTPRSLKGAEEQAEFVSLNADCAVIVAYGLILPKPILNATTCINIHASLLPRWRGAAPIQRAIMAGDKETGITIMLMDEGLDTGDTLIYSSTPIDKDMNAGQLHDKLSQMGAELLIKTLDLYNKKQIGPTKQTGTTTYANKIQKEEAKIEWNLPGYEIINKIRGLSPHPGAYFEYNGEKIKILSAHFIPDSTGDKIGNVDSKLSIACTDGRIYPKRVQRQGKRIMDIEDFLKGMRDFLKD